VLPATEPGCFSYGVAAMTVREASLVDAEPVSLVLAARDGSRSAWAELVDRFTPLLWAVARRHRLSTEDAADAVQMTWLRCVERLDQVRDPDSIAAWLVAICRRESLGVLRRHAPAHSALIAEIAAIADPTAIDAADTLIEDEERTILREAISRLPERQRRVIRALLELYEGADGGYREIAQQLDVPVGSLGPTRQRALHRMRADPRLRALRDGHEDAPSGIG
jgi:RNA polymerase sigma factor (sigma-70 family)